MQGAGIPQHGNARDIGCCILQQFEAFPGKFGARVVSYSGNVATWVSEARDQSELQRLANSRHDDRDRRCRLLGDHDRRSSDRHDNVNAAAHEILSLAREAVPVGIRETAFDHDIATLDIA